MLFFLISATYAQKESRDRNRFLTFSYNPQKLKSVEDNSLDLSNKFGIGINLGRTYYVHHTPVANLIRFGVDVGFMDLNYAHYALSGYDSWYNEYYETNYHQGEIGVQIGPSITILPYSQLKVHLYFRYTPSFSALYDTEEEHFTGCFASFFHTGASISYGMIGIGFEARSGKSKFNDIRNPGHEIDWDKWERGEDIYNNKFKTTGSRIYLQLRF